MRQPEEFDAFYTGARERLLMQTYAMTGDLDASRRAVRDAFVVAWHRWRKLSRLERPEDVVRPHAWRLAQRRHTARVWHRERDIDPGVRASLDALGKLTMAQRKALVLTQLAAVSMAQMAREVGLPLERAERELQNATAALSLTLDVETTQLRSVFEALGSSVAGRGGFPRATIVRRAGAARRRTHTALGAAGAVALLVGSGSLVTDAAGVRPTLEAADPPTPRPPASTPPEATDDEPVVLALPEASLLTTTELDAQYGERTWTAARTTDNSAGNGLVLPCQLERYADPRGDAALVRSFTSSGPPRLATASATQVVEASAALSGAERAFTTTTSWFAGCTESRVQLLGTRTPAQVGDESVQFVLRSHSDPVTTYVVGVARTGLFTTTTALRLGGDDVPDRAAAAALLAAGVTELCALPDAGACAPDEPELVDIEPLPTGEQPAMLSELDLPAVDGVDQPWVGTEPQRPLTNAAATGCDQTVFDGTFQEAPFTRAATRTFVVPEADLPQEFGVTETVAALAPVRAAALVEQVRDQLTSCPTRDLNTEVERLVRRDDGATALTAWRLEVSVSDERSVTFLMAIMRRGTGVAQLGFVPAGDARLSDELFLELAERALARLGQLPAPPPG